jgi:predicted Zn-ribbon and HTH transcriptional regulator
MRVRNRLWCGRQSPPNTTYCNDACEQAYQAMLSKPLRAFYSYTEAAEYLGRDTRTAKKFEGVLFIINKSLHSRRVKPQSCRICGSLFKTHQNRNGYCPGCSRAGEGRKTKPISFQIAIKAHRTPTTLMAARNKLSDIEEWAENGTRKLSVAITNAAAALVLTLFKHTMCYPWRSFRNTRSKSTMASLCVVIITQNFIVFS